MTSRDVSPRIPYLASVQKIAAASGVPVPKMNIALFNWRDLGHPKAGGAEVATDQLAHGLSMRGHDITLFTSTWPGAMPSERRNGYQVVRRGTEVTCRVEAYGWLQRRKNMFDVVIDEVNTLPFLSPLITPNRVVLWMHQLAREVWIAEAPPLIGHIGYALEPGLLSIYRKTPAVTISDSSAASFRSFGLCGEIRVAEIGLRQAEGMSCECIPGRIGYVGRIAPSKRIDHIIRAAALVQNEFPAAELIIVGNGSEREIDRLRIIATEAGIPHRVRFIANTSAEERDSLMKTFDVLAMASMREGWGLVVSEAARFGVPSVVYPVAGLVSSVSHGTTGIVSREQRPASLAAGILEIIGDRSKRRSFGEAAMSYLARFTQDRFIDKWENVLRDVANQARVAR